MTTIPAKPLYDAQIGGFSFFNRDDAPPPMNIILSFEEALKLHLSLGQALARLNSYNRSTTAGKRSAVSVWL